MLNEERLRRLLGKMDGVRICMVGDLCLDLYLYADMRLSRLSRETPHYPLPVVREQASPGGGGNVLQNLRVLSAGEILPVSVIGDDWRGDLLIRELEKRGIDTSILLKSPAAVTNCYCKPMRMGISSVVYEDPRLDFENRTPLTEEDEEKLLETLDRAAGRADVIAVADQMEYGVVTPAVRSLLSEWGKRKPVVADSREHTSDFRNVIVKPNEVEAALAMGRDGKAEPTEEELAEIGKALSGRNAAPAIVTAGERGAFWCTADTCVRVPTVPAQPPVDFVGAGDTFLSAFCCAYAAGADGVEATEIGNLASGVTVKKIGTTGTASKEEILMKYGENSHA